MHKILKAKRLISLLACIVTVLTTFTSIAFPPKVNADSNDLRATYIKMMQGKTVTDLNADGIDELSLDDIRPLALYLSNYYKPMNTILDASSKESSSKDSGDKKNSQTDRTAYKQAMVSTCVDTLGMTEDTADKIVTAVINGSYSSAKPLYISRKALEDLYSWFYVDLDKTNSNDFVKALSYINVFGLAHRIKKEYAKADMAYDNACAGWNRFTDFKTYLDNHAEGDDVRVTQYIFWLVMKIAPFACNVEKKDPDFLGNTVKYSRQGEKIPTIPMYWKDESGKKINCWYSNIECTQALMEAYSDANSWYGQGMALSPYSIDQLQKMDSLTFAESSIFENEIYVDFVGNMILHRRGVDNMILLPACMNPFSLVRQNGSKSNINLLNLKALALYNEGKTIVLNDETYDGRYKVATSWSADGVGKVGSIAGTSKLRLSYGTDIHNVQSGAPFFKENVWKEFQRSLNENSFSSKYGWSFKSIFVGEPFTDDCGTPDPYSMAGDTPSASDIASGHCWHTPTSDTIKMYGGTNDNNLYLGTFMKLDESKQRYTFSTALSRLVTWDADAIANYSSESIFKSADITECKDLLTGLNMASVTTNASETDLGSVNGYANISSELLKRLFVTYVVAYQNFDYGKNYWNVASNATSPHEGATDSIIDLKFAKETFPTVNGTLTFEPDENQISKQVMSMAYYFLHPSEGINYVGTWFKNKLGGIFLKWHEDIVGSSDSNYTTGGTKYLTISTFTSTPNLTDLEWMSSLLGFYSSIIVYVLMFIVMILVCYVVSGGLTIARAFLGFLTFAILSFLPPYLINASTNISNFVSDRVFSPKFDYWAITQLETYMASTKDSNEYAVGNSSDVRNMTALANENSVAGKDTAGYSGVRLKWMSPKKMQYAIAIRNSVENTTLSSATDFIKNTVTNTAASTIAYESYNRQDPSALYVYRDLVDIYKYASVSYNLLNEYNLENKYTAVNGSDAEKAYAKDHFWVSGSDANINSVITNWSYAPNVQCDLGHSQNLGYIKEGTGTALTDYVMANTEHSNTPSANNTTALDYYGSAPAGLKDASSLTAMRNGFLVDNINASSAQTYFTPNTFAASSLLNYSGTIGRIEEQKRKLQDTIKNDSLDISPTNFSSSDSKAFFGLPNSSFFITVNDMIAMNKEGNVLDGLSAGATSLYGVDTATYGDLSDFYYALHSESPFYYMSYNIQDQMTGSFAQNLSLNYAYTPEAAVGTTGKKTAKSQDVLKLLTNRNQAYFYNTVNNDGYGEMRDYMNMHDMFYYIIPMLKEGNDLVHLWDDTYGSTTYTSHSLKVNNDGTFIYNGQTYGVASDGTTRPSDALAEFSSTYTTLSEEEQYKFWHDYNAIYITTNCYTPWVDTMYDCSYAKSQNITVAGKTYTVEDPLNPYSYFVLDEKGNLVNGRYMVFSRSEMKYYGLEWSQLTTVEQKIITLQDDVYKDSLQLANYAGFSDENIINAFAMVQLFDFDKVFSQTGFAANDYTLYPQGWELKAFSYDAYMRLVTSQASGESLTNTSKDGSSRSIYARVQDNTSLFFSILLVINDFIAVYLVPLLKLVFIVVIFFVSILMILSAAVGVELNFFNVAWKSLIKPLGAFTLINIATSLLVSLFMSNGLTDVTKSATPVISLGDPTTAIIMLLILDVLALIMYFKLTKKAINDLKAFVKATVNSISGAISGAVGTVVGAVAGDNIGKRSFGKAGTAVARGGKTVASGVSKAVGKGASAGRSFARGLAFGGGAGLGASGALKATGHDWYNESAEAKLERQHRAQIAGIKAKRKAERSKKQGDKLLNKAVGIDEKMKKGNYSEKQIRKLKEKQAKLLAKADVKFKDPEKAREGAETRVMHGKTMRDRVHIARQEGLVGLAKRGVTAGYRHATLGKEGVEAVKKANRKRIDDAAKRGK